VIERLWVLDEELISKPKVKASEKKDTVADVAVAVAERCSTSDAAADVVVSAAVH
jgi:hypothetical protein